MNYELFPLVLVRLAGAPFDPLERLGTPRTAEIARRALGLERTLQEEGRRLVDAARAAPDGRDALATVAKRVQALRPVHGSGLGDAEARYEAARLAWEQSLVAIRAELESELREARRALRSGAARYLPAFSVFTAEAGDPDLFGARLEGEPPPLNARERQRERTWLMYLQRVAAKNDTMSAFGPTAWGRIDRDRGFLLDPQPGIAARDVYYEKWVVNALAAAIGADPEARPEIPPRLHPAVRETPTGFLRTDTLQEIPLPPELRAAAGRADGERPARDVAPVAVLEELLAKGVILWQVEPVALLAHRLENVRDLVARFREGPARVRWLATIDELLEVQRSFGAAEAPVERHRLMAAAAELARRFGAQPKETARTTLYRGASALGEDCVREARLHVGRDIAAVVSNDAAPWIDLWRDSYTLLATRLAARLRPLFEETPRVGGRTLLPTFMQHCASKGVPLDANGMLELAGPAVDEVRDAFMAQLASRDPDAEEWVLDPADCHVLRDRLGVKAFDEFTPPAVDFMVGARSLDEIASGAFDVVIGELHAPIVTLQHCFSWANPDPALFAQGLGRCMGSFDMLHYGNVRVSATCHTSVDFHRVMPGRFRLASFQRGLPQWPTVRASDVEVFVDESTGDVRTRGPDGRVLGSFARDWFVVWIAFHPFIFFREPYLPRLRLGRCVVQRRAWTLPSEELEKGRFEGTDPALPIAVERLRARHRLPRWIFVRPLPTLFGRTLTGKDKDHKPVFVDLESFLGMEVLASWARKYPVLEVTEMLPTPDRLCWAEGDGRYTFELRALVVPR